MNQTKKLLSLLLLLTFIFGCFMAPSFAAPKEITVSAAANLKNSFEAMATAYTKKTGVKVKFIFGATGQLGQQIENGAPIDVFAAADVKTVKGLVDKNFIDGKTARHYATGTLVLVQGKSAPIKVTQLNQLTDSRIKKIAIANPETAPYGKATVEALQKVGLWKKIKNKVVYANNISDALTYAQTGNVEVAFTAESLTIGTGSKYTAVNEKTYSPITQAMGVVKASKAQKEAFDFVKFVRSAEGKKIMLKYGYSIPK